MRAIFLTIPSINTALIGSTMAGNHLAHWSLTTLGLFTALAWWQISRQHPFAVIRFSGGTVPPFVPCKGLLQALALDGNAAMKMGKLFLTHFLFRFVCCSASSFLLLRCDYYNFGYSKNETVWEGSE